MAAGRCKAAYTTDEWHGYGCSITEKACMFLYPSRCATDMCPHRKACAEKYGKDPDEENEED